MTKHLLAALLVVTPMASLAESVTELQNLNFILMSEDKSSTILTMKFDGDGQFSAESICGDFYSEYSVNNDGKKSQVMLNGDFTDSSSSCYQNKLSNLSLDKVNTKYALDSVFQNDHFRIQKDGGVLMIGEGGAVIQFSESEVSDEEI